MRNAFLIFLLCVVCSPAKAQTPSIVLGKAILRLGMSVGELKAELAKHPPMTYDYRNGMVSNEPAFVDVPTVGGTKGLRMYGAVSFDKGRLSKIDKFWTLSDSPDTAAAIASALYGAVSEATNKSPQLCKVHTWTYSNEDEDYKETTIECKSSDVSRSVHVFIKTLHLLEGDTQDVQVEEVLEIP